MYWNHVEFNWFTQKTPEKFGLSRKHRQYSLHLQPFYKNFETWIPNIWKQILVKTLPKVAGVLNISSFLVIAQLSTGNVYDKETAGNLVGIYLLLFQVFLTSF